MTKTDDPLGVVTAFGAACNAHDIDAALSLCADEVIFESTISSPDRQAVQDARRVHEPLDGILGWRFEGFGDLFVHDQVDCVGLAESAHGREHDAKV